MNTYTHRCTQMSGNKDLCATKGVHLCNQSHCIVQCSSNSCGSGGVECDGGWRNWRGVAGSEKWWLGRGGWCCNTCAVRKLHHLFGRNSLGNKEPSWHSGNDEGEGWWWWWCWIAGQWAGRIVTRAGMCPLKPVLYMEQCKLWCNLLQYRCNICVAFLQYLCIISATLCAIFLQYVCNISYQDVLFIFSYLFGKEEPYFSKFILALPCALCSSFCVKFCPLLWGDCCKWTVSSVQPVDPHF